MSARRTAATISALVAVLALSSVAGYLIQDTLTAEAAEPAPEPTPDASASPGPTREPNVPQRPVPSSCSDAFEHKFWVDEIVAPDYDVSPEPPTVVGQPLSETLSSLKIDPLRCHITSPRPPGSPGEDWSELTISRIAGDQAQAVFAELRNLGYYCLGANTGTNCHNGSLAIPSPHGPSNIDDWNDMHVLRDGLWVQVRAQGADAYQVIRSGFAHAVTARVFGVEW